VGHGANAVARIPPGVVVGAKAVLRAVETDQQVRTVIVAADAPRDTTEPVRRLAAERSFVLVELPSSEELGRRCGITRPVAAAAEVGPRDRGQGPKSRT